MAGKYLDDTGVTEVWTRVKSRSIPVKTITQNGYDSLVDGDKLKNVLYIIEPESGSSSFAIKYKKTDISSGGSSIPSGVILMWHGKETDIPSGWHLCDGTNNTPDLRGKFVLAASSTYGAGTSGGSNTINISQAQMPSHSHNYTNGTGTVALPQLTTSGNASTVTVRGTNTAQTATTTTGSSQAVTVMPPYYALCYIMKI